MSSRRQKRPRDDTSRRVSRKRTKDSDQTKDTTTTTAVVPTEFWLLTTASDGSRQTKVVQEAELFATAYHEHLTPSEAQVRNNRHHDPNLTHRYQDLRAIATDHAHEHYDIRRVRRQEDGVVRQNITPA